MVIRSLFLGLVSGLLLALILPQIVPTTLTVSESMAQVLRNSVRAARYRAGLGGAFKSSWPSLHFTTSSSLQSSNPHSSSQSHLSTSQHIMSAQKSFIDAVKERRTYYQLNKESPISDKQITEIAEKAILHVPSSFNSQSTRLVVLLNKDHDQFWDFVLDVLKPMVPEDQFSGTSQRIGGFKAGYGTVCLPNTVQVLRVEATPPCKPHATSAANHPPTDLVLRRSRAC